MSLLFLDVENGDELIKEWTHLPHVYIVLDYNPAGNGGKDRYRDTIEFDEPGLRSIGWKGIYAMDIEDAYNQLKAHLGENKVQTIVIRSHGGAVVENDKVIDIAIFTDNNNNGKTIRMTDLEYYNDQYELFSQQYPADVIRIETFINITKYIKDGGDFVVGSCHSGIDPIFIHTLHKMINYRINMYGIWWLSHFSYTNNQEVDRTETRRYRDAQGVMVNATTTYMKPSEDGIAYVTKDNTFSNTSMLSDKDTEGNPVDNYAWKFCAKRDHIDMRIKLKDLQLDQNGVRVMVADRMEQPTPKIEMTPPRMTVPEISIPSLPNR